MSKPAAFYATYVDARFMRGLKVMRLSLDVPIEASNEFLKAFGAPDSANPVPCAIARLEVGAYAPEGNGPDSTIGRPADASPGRVESAPMRDVAKGEDKPRTYSRSQIAALKLQDINFQAWLKLKYYRTWKDVPLCDDKPHATADRVLKTVLGIASKRELDLDGPKAVFWEQMLAAYDYRDQVR